MLYAVYGIRVGVMRAVGYDYDYRQCLCLYRENIGKVGRKEVFILGFRSA